MAAPRIVILPPGTNAPNAVRRLTAEAPTPSAEDLERIERAWETSTYGNWAARTDPKKHRVPVVAPHHTASIGAMIGGSKFAGDVALAHAGILVLVELDRFRPAVIRAVADTIGRGHPPDAPDQGAVPAILVVQQSGDLWLPGTVTERIAAAQTDRFKSNLRLLSDARKRIAGGD